jgi:hypothetical protein
MVAGRIGPAILSAAKKEPPSPAAQGDNREASNRVDRSHSMSKKLDIRSNEGESLIRG